MRQAVLDVQPFKSQYAYSPPEAKSAWHLVFDTPEGDNENDAHLYSDDDELFVDYATKEALSFGQLCDLSKTLAYGLLNRLQDIKAGDMVAIFALNSIWYPACVYAIQAAGLVCTLANPKYTKKDLQHHLTDSGAKLCIFDKAGSELATQVCQDVGIPASRRFMLEKEDHQGVKSVWSLSGQERHQPRQLKGTELDQTAVMCYSSGTTGLPKGVITTHRNLWHVAHQLQATWPILGKQNAYIGVIPMYHQYGCFWWLSHAARHHSKVITFPGFLPEQVLQTIQDYRVKQLHSVPPIVLFLAQTPLVEKYDLSSLETVLCGAAPLGIELIKQCEKRLGVIVMGGYGMSETTCYITSDQSDPDKYVRGSVGKLIAGIEGRVVNGELQLRGPNMTPGYHNRPEADKDLYTTDEQGRRWMRTGDVIEMDEDQNIWVTDRVKELIKYKGMQIAPAELEDLLIGHPDVADACVTAINREEEATEVPRAFIHLKEGRNRTEVQALKIRNWAYEKLADYKCIRGGIVFVDAIPKNPSGKLLRRLLRDQKHEHVFGEIRGRGKAKL